MSYEPGSLPWVFQEYTADHPSAPQYIRDLTAAITAGEMTRVAFDDISRVHQADEGDGTRGHLLDLVLYYVRSALQDHALTSGEIAAVHDLKRFLRIAEGEFWRLRRTDIRDVVGHEMMRILLDHAIDEAEERHQVEVQALFDLSYDQYVTLTRAAVAETLEELEREHDGQPGVRWALESRAHEARPAMLRRLVASLETMQRLAELVTGGAREPDEPGRGIPQEVKDRVWRRDQGRCVRCGSSERLEFDHIIPFAKGGASTYRNTQLLCQDCNRAKSAAIG